MFHIFQNKKKEHILTSTTDVYHTAIEIVLQPRPAGGSEGGKQQQQQKPNKQKNRPFKNRY